MTIKARKKCARCKVDRYVNNFGKAGDTRDRLQSWCNTCRAGIHKIAKRKLYIKDPRGMNEQARIARQKCKRTVMEHYGSKCACCGESELDFLTIDHINNDGDQWRKLLKIRSGYSYYVFLKNNDYPDGHQVLCHNCNFSKSKFKVCPHEAKRLLTKQKTND